MSGVFRGFPSIRLISRVWCTTLPIVENIAEIPSSTSSSRRRGRISVELFVRGPSSFLEVLVVLSIVVPFISEGW